MNFSGTSLLFAGCNRKQSVLRSESGGWWMRAGAETDISPVQARGTRQLCVGLPSDPRRIQSDGSTHRPLLRHDSARGRRHQHDALRRKFVFPRRRQRQSRRFRSQLDLRHPKSVSRLSLLYILIIIFRPS